MGTGASTQTGGAPPNQLTASVLASFESCADNRLRQIMQSLVRHLHDFVVDVSLTEAEWAAAISALTATGQITDETRQEFILWSDTLGVSMLVDAIAHPQPAGATESTVLGPFYVPGSPLREPGANIAEMDAGTPAWVTGRVLDLHGRPIYGAEIDVWQNGDNRLYAVQDTDAPDHHLRGRFRTDPDGQFAFAAVRPVPYPIPSDGPVGRMLSRTGRHPWRPAHIHIVVRADGFATLVTHIFDADSEYLDRDTVFAVKPSLIRRFEPRSENDPRRPDRLEGPWVELALDLVLAQAGPSGQEVIDHGRTH
jgi:hydroxyquinol 1,2-dioxygenase